MYHVCMYSVISVCEVGDGNKITNLLHLINEYSSQSPTCAYLMPCPVLSGCETRLSHMNKCINWLNFLLF